MGNFPIDHPLAMAIIAIALTFVSTLLGKYVWDRYFAQTSRITRREFDTAIAQLKEDCVGNREACRKNIETVLTQQKGCLEEAFEEENKIAARRTMTRQALMCIMLTQVEICNALSQQYPNINCGKISKMIVEIGAIE